MSRLTRVVLASLVSLGVIVGIYTSVEGASLTARQERIGVHLVGGAMTNFDRYREDKPAPAPAEIQSDFGNGQGHGCESEKQTSPDD